MTRRRADLAPRSPRAFAASLVVVPGLLAGCLRSTAFVCDDSIDCGSGTCEANGFCSFADPSCPGGRRFGDLSGPVAGQCVGGSPIDAPLPTDAAPGADGKPPEDAAIDAPPAGCPATYAALPGISGHVYRLVNTVANWPAQRATCAAEGGYLAVPDDAVELAALTVFASNTIWVGVSDQASENVFVTVLGAPQTFLPWASGEPDNAPANQGDCVRATEANVFVDDRCSTGFRAVCECEPP